MSERRDARALDRALSGKRSSGSAQVLALATVAQQLQSAFEVEVPAARTTRSTFIQGVGGRGRSWGWLRVFAPATVTALILLIAMFAGRTALPGETLYPVRQVLKAVGLAPITVEEIDGQIAEARELLEDAQRIVAKRPQTAKTMAFEAVKLLGFAEELLPEVSADAAKSRAPLLNSLLARAMQVLEVDGSPTDDPRGSGDQQGALRRDDEEQEDEDDGDDDGDDDDDRSGNSGRAEDGGRDASNDNGGSDRGPDPDDDQGSDRNNSGPGNEDDDAPDPEDDATLGDGDTNDGGNEGPGDDEDDTKGDDEKDDDDAEGDDEEGDDDETFPGAEEALRGEGRSGAADHGGGNDDDDRDAKNKLDGDDDREEHEDDDDRRDDLEINEDELLAI